MRCIQWFKDTNLKANHNPFPILTLLLRAVFNGSKILIWKQITTMSRCIFIYNRCIQWFKDTNLKANHNALVALAMIISAVFNGSKILIWKQITTSGHAYSVNSCCIQWFKDTNLKANHNWKNNNSKQESAVFNGSKILIWKQITTHGYAYSVNSLLYSMVQRY